MVKCVYTVLSIWKQKRSLA